MKVTRFARLWVRFCRLFFWTLAYRRNEWRGWQDYFGKVFRGEIKWGPQHIKVRDADGNIVKNVYVDHGYPSVFTIFLYESYLQDRHTMPRY